MIQRGGFVVWDQWLWLCVYSTLTGYTAHMVSSIHEYGLTDHAGYFAVTLIIFLLHTVKKGLSVVAIYKKRKMMNEVLNNGQEPIDRAD